MVLSSWPIATVPTQYEHKRNYCYFHPCSDRSWSQSLSSQPTCDCHKSSSRLLSLSERPAVTFPATEYHRPLAGTKLSCLVTRHVCVNNLPRVVTWKWNGREINLWPVDRTSDALTCHTYTTSNSILSESEDNNNNNNSNLFLLFLIFSHPRFYEG